MKVAELMLADTQYEFGTLTGAKVSDDFVSLNWDSTGFGYKRELAPDFTPTAGMKTVMWGKGFGYTVRGLAINEKVIFYRTEAEEQARHEEWCRDKERKDKEQYIANRKAYDERIQKLPVEFQRRIYSFELTSAEWGEKFEGYELFVCEQALAIADRLKTSEAIKAFNAMPWDEQKRRVPELTDDHSGNTFGSACSLASLYLTNPELVDKMHGALCPLVGCKEYGCYSARKEEHATV